MGAVADAPMLEASPPCLATAKQVAPESKAKPVFGPWMVTARLRPAPASKGVNREQRSVKVPSPSSSAPSSHSGPGSPQHRPTSPTSPPDSDGWQKPTKVARRCSPEKGVMRACSSSSPTGRQLPAYFFEPVPGANFPEPVASEDEMNLLEVPCHDEVMVAQLKHGRDTPVAQVSSADPPPRFVVTSSPNSMSECMVAVPGAAVVRASGVAGKGDNQAPLVADGQPKASSIPGGAEGTGGGGGVDCSLKRPQVVLCAAAEVGGGGGSRGLLSVQGKLALGPVGREVEGSDSGAVLHGHAVTSLKMAFEAQREIADSDMGLKKGQRRRGKGKARVACSQVKPARGEFDVPKAASVVKANGDSRSGAHDPGEGPSASS